MSDLSPRRIDVKGHRLPDSTRIGYVHLRVADLHCSLSFYRDLLGLIETKGANSTVPLSASRTGDPIVLLTENRDAKRRPRHSAGLFHTAIVLPNRRELARILKRLYGQRWPLQGFADHGVSEALYLADPDGNGLELYADRPRDRWPRKQGKLEMVTLALDLDSLLAELPEGDDPWTGIHPQTGIGHIHLQVSDLRKGERFYHELLGFDVTQRSFRGALFVSAGGYHHHIGLNVWDSFGGTAAPANTVGLAKFSIRVPDEGERFAVCERLRAAGIRLEESQGGVVARDYDGIGIEIN